MGTVSVKDVIARLPEPAVIRDRCRAMAALDAIMSPEWEYRYFSFNSAWSLLPLPSPPQQMASMRNGSGDEYAIVFTPDGVWAHGFDHESRMSPYRSDPPTLWPGLLDGLPDVFRAQVAEPAFCDPLGSLRATVTFWRERRAGEWACGSPLPAPREDDDGGAGWLFGVLVLGADGYHAFAQEYYDVEVDADAIRRFYDLGPVTREDVARLNPAVNLSDLADELRAIGLAVQDGR